MSENDVAIPSIHATPYGAPVATKPAYLIVLESMSGKVKSYEYFLTLDKPDFLANCVQAKGFFSDSSETDIISNFSQLLTSIKKELICEMIFPWHKIHSIRNLIFRAK